MPTAAEWAALAALSPQQQQELRDMKALSQLSDAQQQQLRDQQAEQQRQQLLQDQIRASVAAAAKQQAARRAAEQRAAQQRIQPAVQPSQPPRNTGRVLHGTAAAAAAVANGGPNSQPRAAELAAQQQRQAEINAMRDQRQSNKSKDSRISDSNYQWMTSTGGYGEDEIRNMPQDQLNYIFRHSYTKGDLNNQMARLTSSQMGYDTQMINRIISTGGYSQLEDILARGTTAQAYNSANNAGGNSPVAGLSQTDYDRAVAAGYDEGVMSGVSANLILNSLNQGASASDFATAMQLRANLETQGYEDDPGAGPGPKPSEVAPGTNSPISAVGGRGGIGQGGVGQGGAGGQGGLGGLGGQGGIGGTTNINFGNQIDPDAMTVQQAQQSLFDRGYTFDQLRGQSPQDLIQLAQSGATPEQFTTFVQQQNQTQGGVQSQLAQMFSQTQQPPNSELAALAAQRGGSGPGGSYTEEDVTKAAQLFGSSRQEALAFLRLTPEQKDSFYERNEDGSFKLDSGGNKIAVKFTPEQLRANRVKQGIDYFNFNVDTQNQNFLNPDFKSFSPAGLLAETDATKGIYNEGVSDISGDLQFLGTKASDQFFGKDGISGLVGDARTLRGGVATKFGSEGLGGTASALRTKASTAFDQDKLDLGKIQTDAGTTYGDAITDIGRRKEIGSLSGDLQSSVDTTRGQLENIRTGRDPRFDEFRKANLAVLDDVYGRDQARLNEQFARRGVSGSSAASNAAQGVSRQDALQRRQLTSQLGLQQLGRQDAARDQISNLAFQNTQAQSGLLGQKLGAAGQGAQLQAGLIGQGAGLTSQGLGLQGQFLGQELGAAAQGAGLQSQFLGQQGQFIGAGLGAQQQNLAARQNLANQFAQGNLAFMQNKQDLAELGTTSANSAEEARLNAISAGLTNLAAPVGLESSYQAALLAGAHPNPDATQTQVKRPPTMSDPNEPTGPWN